jgi:uncharacterized membrane protein YdjX (TVP38/TMEM64 family)
MFRQFPQYALLISLCLSILVAISGLLPSVFVTAANIYFFGFWTGTLISFVGEAAGAAIGKISFVWFVLASSLGKIPALLQEAILVQGFLRAGWPG